MSDDPCDAWAHFRATVFRFSASINWSDYAIVTACNPLGVSAPPKQNDAQDLRLREELGSRGVQPVRVYGYSPDLKHQEQSWAAPISRDDAIALGAKFNQDAVFYVRGREVFLESCPPRRRASESIGQLKLVPHGGE